MNFSIDRKYFYDQLSIVARAISPYSPLPALSGICIQVVADRLTLMGSDSTISIKTIIEPNEENQLKIESTGSIIIESKYLLEIIRKLECKIVSFELFDDTLIRIEGDHGTFHLNGIEGSEYPSIDFYQPQNEFILSKKKLKEIVRQTGFACADSDSRPVLNGINFNMQGENLYCSATDTYRLARKRITLPQENTFNITISNRSLNEIVKSLNQEEEDIQIFVDQKKAQFIFDGTTFQTRLLDGTFPDVERIIPQHFISTLQIDARELSNAIDRTNFILTDKVHLIKLECTPKIVEIKTRSSEIGDSKEELLSSIYGGEDLTLTCNGSYMLDALKALGSSRVELSFTGVLKPIKISDPEDDSTLMIVVPVRSID